MTKLGKLASFSKIVQLFNFFVEKTACLPKKLAQLEKISTDSVISVRDEKSLQNSTGKNSSLKNLHTKYVQKMLKIMQK